MNPKRIVIDGKTYNSVDEMPEDVRRRYEQAMSSLKDQNGNHIPDILESSNMLADQNRDGVPDILENTSGANLIRKSIKVLADGKEYNSLDDLPPEARAKYEQAMRMIDKDGNGMPDFLEGMVRVQSDTTSASTSFGTPPPTPVSRAPKPIESPTITPDTTNGWMLGLLVAMILFVCALGAVGVWYFFLR